MVTPLPEHLVAEWHPTKNGDILPQDVAAGSHKKAWWLGKDCGHEWDAVIKNRTKGNRCPICADQKVLTGYNDFATSNPVLALEWHPTKNGNLSPQHVLPNTHKKVWWLREDCGHEWEATVANRSFGTNCPICRGLKVVEGINDLGTLNPSLATNWHPTKNGALLPTQVSVKSNKKVWWICSKGHESNAVINSRNRGKDSCPYCTGKKTLQGFNDIVTLNPKYLKEWHPTKNLPLSPQDVTIGSDKRVWWICVEGHEWNVKVYDRKRGSGCPKCTYKVSQAEQNIADILLAHGLNIEQSNRTLIKRELDIYISTHKLAIEYNGLYWHSDMQGKGRNYHYNKWLACKRVGIQLIQIWEDEWLDNPEQIKDMLLHKLGATQQEKVFARKTVITQLKKVEIESFLDKHHIQGYASGSYYLGLKEKNTGEVVSVLVLKKEAHNTLNIIRYATSKNVVGGFTKLLKYAELTFQPARFITFSDHCVSDGGLYKNNGFTVDKELPPDYRYVVGKTRFHKFGYRLKRFKDDPNLKWQDGLTERELADLNGISRIWDAGKTRWVKNINIAD